jgi:hypothetical protein
MKLIKLLKRQPIFLPGVKTSEAWDHNLGLPGVILIVFMVIAYKQENIT